MPARTRIRVIYERAQRVDGLLRLDEVGCFGRKVALGDAQRACASVPRRYRDAYACVRLLVAQTTCVEPEQKFGSVVRCYALG